jgi:hypothetical protein
MAQLEKERKQRRRWEKMKTRGHALELALNVSICVGSYAVVRLIHIVLFKSGWMQSPGATSWEDVFIWGVAGIIGGELDWADMKRKFRNPPPEEDWVTK